MSGKVRTLGARLVEGVRRAENLILALLLTAMIVVATARIVQRNVFGGGQAWTDELLQTLVLWIALLGAMAAARDANHISMDLVGRILARRWSAAARAAAYLFTSIASGFIAWSGYKFVGAEMEYGAKILGQKIPAWAIQTLIPVAFCLIAIRYLGHFFKAAAEALNGGET